MEHRRRATTEKHPLSFNQMNCKHSPSNRSGFSRFGDFLFHANKLYSFKTGVTKCANCGTTIVPFRRFETWMKVCWLSTSALGGAVAGVIAPFGKNAVGPFLSLVAGIIWGVFVIFCVQRIVNALIYTNVTWVAYEESLYMPECRREDLFPKLADNIQASNLFFFFVLGFTVISRIDAILLMGFLVVVSFVRWLKQKDKVCGIVGSLSLLYIVASLFIQQHYDWETMKIVDSFAAIFIYVVLFCINL